MMRLLMAAVLVAAVFLPTGQAQVPTGLTLSMGNLAAPIPYSGSATLGADLIVSCESVLRSLGETQQAVVHVVALSPPTWLTVGDASVDLADQNNAPSCVTRAGALAQHLDVPLTVSADAPGVVDNLVMFSAVLGNEHDEDNATVVVAYHVAYTLKADVTFPLTMKAAKATFNLTATQASNARSMIMMEEVKQSAGSIAGLTSTVYDSAAGKPATKVFKVTYTAPDGAWNKTTVSFKAYGHYLLLDSRAGPFDVGTPVSWEFVNGGIPAPHTDAKKSPLPVAPYLGLGLVALAGLLRRRG